VTGRSARTRIALTAGLAALMIAGCALGVWQLQRMGWKHDLITAVESRVRADPVPAPGPATWLSLTAERDAYRHVWLTGRYRHDRETLVQAVTDRGAGFWVLTPLDTGIFTVLVNRGFVPPEARDRAARAEGNVAGIVTVRGLLRVSEPGGGFLRSNDPRADRWYSRDVAAIVRARGLTRTAPYFVDADATPNPGGLPVGGLTVVQFPNNHLIYALTWFGLALGCAFAIRLVWKQR
jgi:surfeit locus 1 family protein